jgi:hypothetical protein
MGKEVELESFVMEQLEIHKKILKIVKEYADKLIYEVFGLDPEALRGEDPSTYFAIVMELTRSIFVNYSVETRKRGSYYQKSLA